MTLRAIVRDGRLIVDEPTALPEGTIVDLVLDDEGDDLDEAERAALHAHLDASWNESERGNVVPADEVLAELRRR